MDQENLCPDERVCDNLTFLEKRGMIRAALAGQNNMSRMVQENGNELENHTEGGDAMKSAAARTCMIGWILLVGIVFQFTLPPTACAQDAKTMLKEVNKALRQAQKDMFSGKNEKAIASLPNIQDLLKKIKEAEQQAGLRIETSQKESADLLSKAETDSKEIIDKACADAKKNAADMMQTACRDAEAQAGKIIQEGTAQSRQVAQNGQAHVAPAAEIIVSQVIGDA